MDQSHVIQPSGCADVVYAVEPGGQIEIVFEGEGIIGVEAVLLTAGDTAHAIAACAAAKGGFPLHEALVFLEDEPEPLKLDVVISCDYPHRRKHHVHRSRSIEVVVNYVSRSIHRSFSPSTKIETVLAWALRDLSIDLSVAPEFELALIGSTDELPGSRHVGSLVHHPSHRLELNLIRGVIPNGAER